MNNFLSCDLKLVKARERLGAIMPGQPLLFQYWPDQVAVFDEPTIFLREKFVAVGGTPSKHTWEAAGYDLLTWFQWCQLKGKGIDWRDATEADRQQFADDYAAASEANTVNRKLTVIRRFYDLCRAEGWYHRDIGSSLEKRPVGNSPIDDDALAHTRSTVTEKEKDPLLRKVGRNDVVRPLQLTQVRKLLKHLGPAPEDKEDRRPVRDRVMVELALLGGARLGDVVGLTTLKFLSITVEPHQMLTEFPLIVIGKGKVTRQVAVPGWLVMAVQKYINGERAESERKGKKLGGSGRKPTTDLFLGDPKSKAAGKAIGRSAVQKMFELACRKCGITEMVEIADPETGKTHIKTVSAHSFHDLRHNCAVITYHAEKMRAIVWAREWLLVVSKRPTLPIELREAAQELYARCPSQGTLVDAIERGDLGLSEALARPLADVATFVHGFSNHEDHDDLAKALHRIRRHLPGPAEFLEEARVSAALASKNSEWSRGRRLRWWICPETPR